MTLSIRRRLCLSLLFCSLFSGVALAQKPEAKATPLLSWLPDNARWVMAFNLKKLRSSPHRELLLSGLRAPVFGLENNLAKAGISVADDLDEVLIAADNPWGNSNQLGFVGRYSKTEAEIKKKLEDEAKKNSTKLISGKISEREVWLWESEVKLSAKERLAVVLLSPGVVMASNVATLQKLFALNAPKAGGLPGAGSKKFLKELLPEQSNTPAFFFAVSDMSVTLPLKVITNGQADWGGYLGFIKLPPEPVYACLSLEIEEALSGVAIGSFSSEADAKAGVLSLNGLLPLASSYLKQDPLGQLFAPLFSKAKFTDSAAEIRSDVSMTSEELQKLLSLNPPNTSPASLPSVSTPPAPTK